MAYVANELLSRLTGMRLIAVEFILDYLVVRFDGDPREPQALLTCEVMPSVESRGRGLVRDGSPAYGDALRSLIGHEVTNTMEAEGIGLRIELDPGVLVISPSLDELAGPEIALLTGFEDGSWMCWRPGEESFEHLG